METSDKAALLAELNKLLAPEKPARNDYTNEILSKILTQLDNLENQIAANHSLTDKSFAVHPSQQKFQITEVNEIVLPNTNEKACRFEPNKPCDYCSMCSAHGF